MKLKIARVKVQCATDQDSLLADSGLSFKIFVLPDVQGSLTQQQFRLNNEMLLQQRVPGQLLFFFQLLVQQADGLGYDPVDILPDRRDWQNGLFRYRGIVKADNL